MTSHGKKRAPTQTYFQLSIEKKHIVKMIERLTTFEEKKSIFGRLKKKLEADF